MASKKTGYKIDDLDRGIIQLLSENARLSNRKIAAQLGFTEGTIRERVKRLEKENCIRFTAVSNMAHLKRSQLAYIGVHAEQNMVREVANRISELPEIGAVIILLGRFEILAIGLFEGVENVQDTASNNILSIPGVRYIETTLVAKIVKYDNRVAKIIRSTDDYNLEYVDRNNSSEKPES